MAIRSVIASVAAAVTGEPGAASRTDNKDGATLRIVDLISEGPIVGLSNDEQTNRSIFINDLPIQGNDGTFNYNGVKWTFLPGGAVQNAPTGFGVVETTTPVGRELELGSPVVIRVRGRGVDAVNLAIRFPSMFKQNDDGSTVGASAQLKFEAKAISSIEYTDAGLAHISKKSTSAFERNYRIDFEPLRSENNRDEDVDIRVSRLDAKSTSLRLNNDSFLASYVSISDSPIAYANSAIVAMEIDAEEFGSNPTKRTFDVIGLKVQIPENYFPRTHTYRDGGRVWNGTFKQNLEWTDNPVWLLYALLTNERYGLGNVISPDQIDKFSFYAAARYCDEKVPNGRAGTEPRFVFNGTINTTRGAYATLNLIASTFRARILWGAGMVSLVQDRPQSIKGVVTKSNVEGGNFSYTGSGLSVRHTAAKVSWINPDDNWQANDEIVENNKAVQNSGWRQLDVNGYGITSKAQARRLGLWVLQTELNETEVVSYNAGLDQVAYGPGDLIVITDNLLNAEYHGGRILATDDTPPLEKTLRFDRSGNAFVKDAVIWIATNDPDEPIVYVKLVRVALDRISWVVRGVLRASNIPRFVQSSEARWAATTFEFGPGAIWGIFDPQEFAEPRLWRVISIEETDPGAVKVEALQYYPEKFALVDALAAEFADPEETEFQLQPPSTIAVDSDSITLEPYVYRVNDVVQESATLSWEPIDDPRILRYEVQYSSIQDTIVEAFLRTPGTTGLTDADGFIYNWQLLGTTTDSAVIITNFEQNPYYIRIRWVDDQGRSGPYSEIKVFEPEVFEDIVSAVENFKVASLIDGLLLFTWDATASALLSHYEMRHNVDDVSWERASVVDGGARITATNFDTVNTNGYYYLRAISVTGNQSESSVVQSSLDRRPGLNIAAEYFRPASASTASDEATALRLEVTDDLEELGADLSQIQGTIISDWFNTTSRLHRDDLNSYFERPNRPTFLPGRFSTDSVDDSGQAIRDWTRAWYPRISTRAGRVFAYNENGTTEDTDLEIRSDPLEATNSESIDDVLYSEPLATLSNWANLDFPESICVHKSIEGTADYPVSGEDALTSRKVYEDNAIGFEIRRSIQSTVNFQSGPNYFGGLNKILFLKDYLYRTGFDPALDANPDLRLRATILPGLLVSKNERPAELRPLFQRRLEGLDPGEFPDSDYDIEAFGDRSHADQWYETSENLMPIGNIGYNKTTTITLPAVDFGSATTFNFVAEVEWESELADNITDYKNRVPDRIDISNTDNTFNAALPRGGSGGSEIQHNNGITLSQSPNLLLGTTNQLALIALGNESVILSLEMRYIDTSDRVSFLDSDFSIASDVDRLNIGVRTGQAESGVGEIPSTGEITLREPSNPNIFTTSGTRTATVVWPTIVIRRPSGIYSDQCSLFRDKIKSVIIRFDVEDRRASRRGIAYESDIANDGSWLLIEYGPAFARTPALVIDAEALGSDQVERRNENNRGFEVRFVNTRGIPVDKTFTYIADGFGVELTPSTERLFNV